MTEDLQCNSPFHGQWLGHKWIIGIGQNGDTLFICERCGEQAHLKSRFTEPDYEILDLTSVVRQRNGL